MSAKNHKLLKIYSSTTGKEPFSEWLDSIKDRIVRARIRRRLDLLEMGHYGDCKSVGQGVYELRLQFGAGYRIYFAELDNTIIILLCAGDKNSQAKDIKNAKNYWLELQEQSYED